MVRNADHVITCSHYMRGHVGTTFRVPPARISAIPNGIDPHDLEPRRPRPRRPAREVRPAGRAARAAGGPPGLREGLPPRARRARPGDPPLRRRALRGGGHGHGRGRAEAPGAPARAELAAERSSAGSATTCSTRSTAWRTSASSRRSTSRSASWRWRRWPRACLCIVADTGGLREVVPGDGRVGRRFRWRDSGSLGEILERRADRRRRPRAPRGRGPRARAAVRLGRGGPRDAPAVRGFGHAACSRLTGVYYGNKGGPRRFSCHRPAFDNRMRLSKQDGAANLGLAATSVHPSLLL